MWLVERPTNVPTVGPFEGELVGPSVGMPEWESSVRVLVVGALVGAVVSGDSVAGPTVQIIFVRRIIFAPE